MDIAKLVAELQRELADIDAAIESLERLERQHPRRGRKPKALSRQAPGQRGQHPAPSSPKNPE